MSLQYPEFRRLLTGSLCACPRAIAYLGNGMFSCSGWQAPDHTINSELQHHLPFSYHIILSFFWTLWMLLLSYLWNHIAIVTCPCLLWFWECLEARAHVCFTFLFNQTPNPPQLSENMLWGGEGWWLDRGYRPHWWRCPLLHVGSKWLFFSLFLWRDGVLWSTGRWGFPAPAMEVAQWWHEEVVSDFSQWCDSQVWSILERTLRIRAYINRHEGRRLKNDKKGFHVTEKWFFFPGNGSEIPGAEMRGCQRSYKWGAAQVVVLK